MARKAEVGKRESVAIASPSEPCLDQDMLNELDESLGYETVADLVGRHLVDTRDRVHRLKAAAEAEDLDSLRGEAHDLKSTAGSFGASHVLALAGQLERACRDKECDRALDLVPEVEQAVDAAIMALAARYRITLEAAE